jgi:hypothetical protein
MFLLQNLPHLTHVTLDHCDLGEKGLMHPYTPEYSAIRVLNINRCKKKRAFHLMHKVPGRPVIDYF